MRDTIQGWKPNLVQIGQPVHKILWLQGILHIVKTGNYANEVMNGESLRWGPLGARKEEKVSQISKK